MPGQGPWRVVHISAPAPNYSALQQAVLPCWHTGINDPLSILLFSNAAGPETSGCLYKELMCTAWLGAFWVFSTADELELMGHNDWRLKR